MPQISAEWPKLDKTVRVAMFISLGYDLLAKRDLGQAGADWFVPLILNRGPWALIYFTCYRTPLGSTIKKTVSRHFENKYEASE